MTEKIKISFDEINKYCDGTKFLSESDCSHSDTRSETVTMTKFDLKTAVSFLSVMNGKEKVTKQLIRAIEILTRRNFSCNFSNACTKNQTLGRC